MRLFHPPLIITCIALCTSAIAESRPRSSEESLDGLIERLKPPHTLTERLRAAEALSAYGQFAVEPLIGLLHDNDSRTRYYACVALTRLGPCAEAAIPDLTAIAADSNERSQLAAVNALGRIGPAAVDAVPILLCLSSEGHWVLRKYAVQAVLSIGPSALPLVLESLQDDDAALAQSACSVLRLMGPTATNTVPVLASLVFEVDEELRESIFLALADIGSAALDDLTDMLRHRDANVRRLAAMAISRMGREATPALPALCDATDDQDASVRFWAVGALGEIGDSDREVTDCLIRTSLDEDADVRWQTAVTLSKTGVNGSMRQVLARLQSDSHPAVRAQAAKVQ
jgi:HEAT repeat protein